MNNNTTKRHELKTWPVFFEPIIRGTKTFEIRKNDQDFRMGDTLLLREYNPLDDTYTGRQMEYEVGFMIIGDFGLQENICCMSLIKKEDPKKKPQTFEQWLESLDALHCVMVIRDLGLLTRQGRGAWPRRVFD